jgi:hypothetical protein
VPEQGSPAGTFWGKGSNCRLICGIRPVEVNRKMHNKCGNCETQGPHAFKARK